LHPCSLARAYGEINALLVLHNVLHAVLKQYFNARETSQTLQQYLLERGLVKGRDQRIAVAVAGGRDSGKISLTGEIVSIHVEQNVRKHLVCQPHCLTD